MNTVVQVKNIAKSYGSRSIFAGLSLDIPDGASLAIVGRSGSGKSTLLNIIGMLETADSGQVFIDGAPIPHIHSRKAMMIRRHTVNYLFQNFALIPSQSVQQNILLGMKYLGVSRSEKQQRIGEVLERLSIRGLAGEKVSALSGGEQQRVALARCLLKPGKLILADEPTGSLDRELADRSLAEMLRLQKEFGKTLVMVTHDPAIAQRCEAVFDLSGQ